MNWYNGAKLACRCPFEYRPYFKPLMSLFHLCTDEPLLEISVNNACHGGEGKGKKSNAGLVTTDDRVSKKSQATG